MASRIEFITIDEQFPLAGQDNDSQGFRDNFGIIKTSLGNADDNFRDLEENGARRDSDNNFANNSLINANLDSFTQQFLLGGTQTIDSGTQETPDANKLVKISEGHYHSYVIGLGASVTGNAGSFRETTLQLTDWPAENFSSVIVELSSDDDGPYLVKFASENGGRFLKETTDAIQGVIDGDELVGVEVFVQPSILAQIVQFWTYNGGETIYAKSLGEFGIDGLGIHRVEGVITNWVDLRPYADNEARDADWPNPIAGEIVFVTNVDGSPELQGYSGTEWINMLGAGDTIEVTPVSASFTINRDSIGRYYRASSVDALEVTVPTDLSYSFPLGSSVSVIQTGEGSVNILAEEGAIVNSADSFYTTRTKFSAATLTKVANSEWDLVGDLKSGGSCCAIDWDDMNIGSTGQQGFEVTEGRDGELGGSIVPDNCGANAVQFDKKSVQLFNGGQVLRVNMFRQEYGVYEYVSFFTDEDASYNPNYDFNSIRYMSLDQTVLASNTMGNNDSVELLILYNDDGIRKTTGPDFAPDEFVLYFVPGVVESTAQDFVWDLTYRAPDDFRHTADFNIVSTSTSVVLPWDPDAGAPPVYKVVFEAPGAFNGIRLSASYGQQVAILDSRLCKDNDLMTWPLYYDVDDGGGCGGGCS